MTVYVYNHVNQSFVPTREYFGYNRLELIKRLASRSRPSDNSYFYVKTHSERIEPSSVAENYYKQN